MRILLINSSTYRDISVFPIGLDYLVSHLLDHGYKSIHCLDLAVINPERRQQAIINQLKNKYDVIGLSFRNLTDQLYQAVNYLPAMKKLVSFIRENVRNQNLETQIVVGGSALTLLPEVILEKLGADYGIAGEGESGFLWLLGKLSQGTFPTSRIITQPFTFQDKIYRRGSWPFVKQYLALNAQANKKKKRGCNRRCLYCVYPVI